MKRILNDPLHRQGKGFHFGWMRQGNCWKFRFEKKKYATCTFYSFWRLFISFDKKPSIQNAQ